MNKIGNPEREAVVRAIEQARLGWLKGTGTFDERQVPDDYLAEAAIAALDKHRAEKAWPNPGTRDGWIEHLSSSPSEPSA